MVFGNWSRNSISAGSSIFESLPLQELQQLRRGRRLALFQLHEGLRRLAAIFVGNADHGHLGNGVVLVDRILDPPRIDFEARGVDHVLDAIDDEDEAVGVHVTDVAGAEEAPDEAPFRLLRLLPIAGHHLRPGDADLAGLAARHLDIGIIERADGDLGGGQREADRALAVDLRKDCSTPRARSRSGRSPRPRYSRTIAWKPCFTSSGSAAPPERQYSSEERSKLPICGCRSMAFSRVGTRRHHARAQLADQLQRLDQLEFRHEDHLHAAGDAVIHHRGHGEHVEQRQDAEDPVALVRLAGSAKASPD